MSACERIAPWLDGYHDGELGVLRRSRIRWHLAGCSGCRDELAALDDAGSWVRAALDIPPPDLWSGIQLRLPAERSAEAARRASEPASPRRMRPALAFAMPTLGVALASAALVLTWNGPGGLTWFAPDPASVVRSLNTHGRPVMVLDGPDDPTVIWLMDDEQPQAAEESTSVWI